MARDYRAPRSHSKLSRSAFLPWLGTWELHVIPKKLQFSDEIWMDYSNLAIKVCNLMPAHKSKKKKIK